MKRWMNGLFALALALGLGGVALEAEAAKRLGGGGSVGMQRNVTPPPAKAPTAAPQQAAPAAAAPAAAAPAAAGGASRWLGPIAGIAAGLGLGWLIGQSGMGGMVGSLMLGLLLVFGLVIAFKLLTRGRSQQPAMAGAGAGYGQGNSQYAGLGQETVAAPPPSQPIGGAWGGNTSAAAPAAETVAPKVPAGFDVAGFVKQARLNFNRLQDANDRADLSLLRDVCTEEMFASLKEQIGTRTTPVAPTEISQLDAQLIEVTTEGQYHWASVSFSGLSSDEPGQPAQPFHEVWNLRKSVSGDTGWLLAGIQQVS